MEHLNSILGGLLGILFGTQVILFVLSLIDNDPNWAELIQGVLTLIIIILMLINTK